MINFNGAYLMGSDRAENGTPDWWLWNGSTGHFMLTANPDDSLTINYGLQHTGSTLGFYGATPVTKSTVVGCRCEGEGLAVLLNQLS